MKAILNHQIIDRDKILLTTENRGFTYGDGFFETISVISRSPRFLAHHLARLKKAAAQFKMDASELLDEKTVASEINNLLDINKFDGFGKLKIYLWRESEGLYSPLGAQASLLLTIESSSPPGLSIASNADFSEKVFNFPTPYSPFKTMSALKYVLAGIERDDKNLDDILLLDHRGNVSEALNANIFWKQGGRYFTPPLSAGCIDGIMRNWLMAQLEQRGLRVEESLISKDTLLLSESVFTSNSSGVRHIKRIDGVEFEVDQLVEDLLRSIS